MKINNITDFFITSSSKVSKRWWLISNVFLNLWLLSFACSFIFDTEKKILLFNISCVLSICFSIIQVSNWIKPKWFENKSSTELQNLNGANATEVK